MGQHGTPGDSDFPEIRDFSGVFGTPWDGMGRRYGGEGWIRTSVRLRGQIYSLLPLTTRPPLHGAGRRAKWRRGCGVSTREGLLSPSEAKASRGAGEGNRTLVVSLEGFCSTIELHPLAGRQCHCRARCVNRPKRLTNPKPLPYHAIRMTHLVAIAAISNSRLWWWQSASLAARWRD